MTNKDERFLEERVAMVDCPRGCGWPGCPDLDEDGRPYSCFYCCDRGEVPASWVQEAEQADALAASVVPERIEEQARKMEERER